MMKAFAQPNGGNYFTNAAGERQRYTTTSRQGRQMERTGTTSLGGPVQTGPRAGQMRTVRQVSSNRVANR